jgi:pimeloyl-ACP methyl ester carboxylesterase
MTTYVLVHGAWHGAWCWERLAPLLTDAGHDVVAVDLPCDDVSKTFADYADVTLAALGDHEGVVLVAHSLGGITATLVAEHAPERIRRLVYLCGVLPRVAGMPHEGEPRQADDAVFAALGTDGTANWWADDDAAISAFYADTEAATARWAVSRLRRQATTVWRTAPTLAGWPAVPISSVICTQDRVIEAPWGRWVAERWLGVEPVELPGDHSPMLSRPGDLAATLLELSAPERPLGR